MAVNIGSLAPISLAPAIAQNHAIIGDNFSILRSTEFASDRITSLRRIRGLGGEGRRIKEQDRISGIAIRAQSNEPNGPLAGVENLY